MEKKKLEKDIVRALKQGLLLLFIPYAAILFMGWTLRAPSIRVPGLAPFRRAAGGARR